MKKFVIISGIFLFISCARKYSVSNAFKNGVPADMQQWVIDSSYKLYIREVFLDTANPGDKRVLQNNSTGNRKLIEIEYLLLSTEGGKAVYISTIPDKYQTYYAKKSLYLKREYLNAYDFSTFRFGKADSVEKEVVFEKNKNRKDIWKYKIDNSGLLRIYEVIEKNGDDDTNIYLVDEAIGYPASFVQTDSFRIAFRNMKQEYRQENKKRGRPPLQRFTLDNIIYYRQQNNKYTLYFRFNKTLPPQYKDSAISFGNSRLVSPPF